MTEQELQQKSIELQLLNQQLNQLQQQIMYLEKQFMDLTNIKENISEIQKAKKDTQMFTPLGPGIFVETELKDNQKVLMNIGAKVAVKKTMKEAEEIIDSQKGEIETFIRENQEQLQQTAIYAMELEKELVSLKDKLKKN